MATAKVLKNEKVRKLLDKNDELLSKTLDKSHELTEKALERNRDIWLAGLGAFSKAREESNELFHKLVDAGEKFEDRYRDFVDESSDSALKTVTSLLEKIPSPSEKIEDVFDSRVAKALTRLGVVPTVHALQTLSEQVENLTARIEEYVDTTPESGTQSGKKAVQSAKRKPVAKKTAARKPAAKKPAAKKVAAKKTASKKTVNKKPTSKKVA
jgi:poly(hydroxyalkanoate) granule-associated protein